LSKIAQRFGVTVSAIRAANKLQGNRILVGQKLVIPKLGNESLAGGETDVTVVETTEIFIKPDKKSAGAGKDEFVSGIIHVVQPRENMRSIAKMYAVTVDELAEFNSLFPNDKVLVGQRLKIP